MCKEVGHETKVNLRGQCWITDIEKTTPSRLGKEVVRYFYCAVEVSIQVVIQVARFNRMGRFNRRTIT